MNIRSLDAADVGYALIAWREAYKQAPGVCRVPWEYYRAVHGVMLKQVIDDPATTLLGAYEGSTLLGFLVMTRGKRVHTLHWCQIKNKADGKRVRDRRELFFKLLDAADLGSRFVYTLRGPRCRKETGARSLDELLVADLRARGVVATLVPLREWLK